MLMRLLLALLLLAPGMALAGSVTVQWDNPTTYTDGTPLPSTAITRSRIEYGSCGAAGAFGTKAGEFIVTGAATSGVSPNIAAATYCFRVFTTASALESAASGVLQVVVPQAPPNPPTLRTLAVVAGINMAPLYRINADGSRGTALLGFVPVGAACAGPVIYTYRGKGYRRPADFSVAKWEATAPTTSAAAPCG